MGAVDRPSSAPQPAHEYFTALLIVASPAQCVGDTRPGMQAETLGNYLVHLHFGVTLCTLVGHTGFGAGTLTMPVPVRVSLAQLCIDAVTVIVAVIVVPLSAFFTL